MNSFVNIHTHRPQFQNIEIINLENINNWASPNHFSFGLHPWNIEITDLDLYQQQIISLIDEKKIIAIGEAGIDRIIGTNVNLQKQVFMEQVAIAEQFNMPIITHCVKAWSDLSEIRKKTKATAPWIYHGFTANLQTARKIILQGNYLSFGPALLTNPKVQEVFTSIPIDKIFLETDDSNEKIETIYKKAAELHHICDEELQASLYQNFITVFGK